MHTCTQSPCSKHTPQPWTCMRLLSMQCTVQTDTRAAARPTQQLQSTLPPSSPCAPAPPSFQPLPAPAPADIPPLPRRIRLLLPPKGGRRAAAAAAGRGQGAVAACTCTCTAAGRPAAAAAAAHVGQHRGAWVDAWRKGGAGVHLGLHLLLYVGQLLIPAAHDLQGQVCVCKDRRASSSSSRSRRERRRRAPSRCVAALRKS